MTAALYVSDSTGTTQAVKVVYIADGSAVRLVKLIYASDSTGTTQLVYSAFTPEILTYTTVANGTITIPPYCFTMEIEVWGPSGLPGHGAGSGDTLAGGGGAGSGGYAHSIFSVGQAAGQTINFSVAANNFTSNVYSGTFTLTTLSGFSGGNGEDAPSAGRSGTEGAAGATGTGGNVNNAPGLAGSAGTDLGGAAGAGVVGVNGVGQSGGHGGSGSANAGLTPGVPGLVIVKFS